MVAMALEMTGASLADVDPEEDASSSSSGERTGDVTASTASCSGAPESGHDIAEAFDAQLVPAPKHPLQHSWCLWVLLPSQTNHKDNWQNSQMNVYTFSTVEDCWRLFNNIKSPSRLGVIDFSIFKKDVSPAWEDETCRHGGRWIAKLDKKRPQDCDDLWLTLVLTMVGEELSSAGPNICGAVISSRAKATKLSVWTSKREESEALPIGLAFQQILQDIGHSGDLSFEDFASGSKAPFSLGAHAASPAR